ncbi:MAG TPA: hypothetical protein VMY41_13955 [Thermohalobaculum sp.]|nr:hypothetical protein [Thermohalobaculum sp.]
MRYFLICAMMCALLSACSSSIDPRVGQEPPADCALAPVDGAKDGGLGGTGDAPEPCDENRVVE